MTPPPGNRVQGDPLTHIEGSTIVVLLFTKFPWHPLRELGVFIKTDHGPRCTKGGSHGRLLVKCAKLVHTHAGLPVGKTMPASLVKSQQIAPDKKHA